MPYRWHSVEKETQMILTKHFVFVHLPKTGGTFVAHVLGEHAPPEWNLQVFYFPEATPPFPKRESMIRRLYKGSAELPQRVAELPSEGSIDEIIGKTNTHPFVRDIPPPHSHLPVFSFVRNPWDWYVSWYFFSKKHGKNAFFNEVSDFGQRDFKHTLLHAFNLDFLRNSGVGGYTLFVMHALDGDLDEHRIGRFENLRADLMRILQEIADVPEVMHDAIMNDPKVNAVERSPYQEYYDDELRTLVQDRDRPLIERFGYTFKQPS